MDYVCKQRRTETSSTTSTCLEKSNDDIIKNQIDRPKGLEVQFTPFQRHSPVQWHRKRLGLDYPCDPTRIGATTTRWECGSWRWCFRVFSLVKPFQMQIQQVDTHKGIKRSRIQWRFQWTNRPRHCMGWGAGIGWNSTIVVIERVFRGQFGCIAWGGAKAEKQGLAGAQRTSCGAYRVLVRSRIFLK